MKVRRTATKVIFSDFTPQSHELSLFAPFISQISLFWPQFSKIVAIFPKILANFRENVAGREKVGGGSK